MAITLVNAFNLDDGGAAQELEGASSLTTATFNGRTFLYVAAELDFGPSAYEIGDDGGLTRVNFLSFSSLRKVHIASADGQPFLFTNNFAQDFFAVIFPFANGFMNADDTFTDAAVDTGNSEFNGPSDFASATISGNTILFVAGAEDDGVSSFRVNPNGILVALDNIEDADNLATLKLDGVQSLATATIGANTFLFAGGFNDDGISAFLVNASGVMSNIAAAGGNVADTEGAGEMFLNGVAALTTAVVGSKTFLFAAGQNDDGVSVFEVAATGTLTNVDNVSDAELMGFNLDGANSLHTVNIAGTTYLFVGAGHLGAGADDGVSVFAVAADGTLINVANLFEGGDLELDGTSSMTTAVIGGKTFLFVSGSDDSGISSFRMDVTGLTINGTGGNDTINAISSAPGQLLPSELGDVINGLGGNDTLAGLGGNDVITGGTGRDIQFGGLGADRFDFNAVGESKKGAQRDRLEDFQRGQDDIDLRTIDAKTGSGNQAFKFIGKQGFHDEKGELRFKDNGAMLIVQGDRNGDGKADFEIFVKIGALSAGDFLL